MVLGNFRVAYEDDGTDSSSDDDRSIMREDVPTTRGRVGGRGVAGEAFSGRRLHFPLEQLQQYYHLPLKAAAHKLGVCEAALKRICRRNNIKKWPFRQLQSVVRRIEEESRLDILQYAFQHSETFLAGFSASTSSSGFLLPHELEDRRKSVMVLEMQLAREQHSRKKRIQQLKKEKQLIIDSAHMETSSLEYYLKANRAEIYKEDDEDSSPAVALDRTDVEDPLDMLASLCVLELSRGKTQGTSSKSRHAIRESEEGVGDVLLMEILARMTAKPTAGDDA